MKQQKDKLEHSKIPRSIEDKSGAVEVCVFINDILHLKFLKKDFVGILTWYESKVCFKIEIYTKYNTIKTEYNSIEKFKSILKILNENT